MIESMCLVNEVLFTVKHYFVKTPKAVIANVISGYYTDDEVSEAKAILMSYAERVDSKFDELKNIKNRTGTGKRKRECEDLLLSFTSWTHRHSKGGDT